ncbi:MAG: AEC family transporter [Deltaproteobacteria bacterium]|nr:AEC family transporter [Deltaproteobacteria bacterium]
MTIVLENLFPIFALMAAGKLMRHWNFTTEAFLRVSDRLVYFIFFPAMLFWKIGGAPPDLSGESAFYAAVTLAVAAVYLLSTTFIIVGRVGTYQAGSFSQSCYRINTFIGVAVMMSTFGEEGVRRFGILIGIFVPLIHVLSISTLIWFGGKRVALRAQISQTARALATNPLVLACVGGMIYGQLVNRFPGFIDNTLRLASYVTLPLALLSVGSMLTLESLRTHLRLALAASLFKLLVLPAIGFMCLRALGTDGPSFRIGMIFFSLPTSSAAYILSSQLNSDPELASAAIALSTLLSFFSLSAALLM